METLYRHRQIGWATMIIFVAVILIVSVGLIIVLKMRPNEELGVVVAALVGLVILLAVMAVNFFALTVRITNEKLTIHFGLGLIRKRVPLRNIASVSPVTNRWWYGLGIHLTPHGWLYNVSGLKAVEMHMWNGQVMRLGTDEPEILCRAIDQARAMNPSA